MPITVGGYNTAQTNSASSLSVTIPTGVQDGDVLVAYLSTDRGTPNSAPSGWVVIGSKAYGNSVSYAYYKIVTTASNEPASYTWGITTAANPSTVGISAFSGVDLANVLDVSANTASGASSTVTVASVTTVTDGALLIGCVGADDTNTYNVPSGMAREWQISNSGASGALLTEPRPTAGATGSRTFTRDNGLGSITAIMTALRPITSVPSFSTLAEALGTASAPNISAAGGSSAVITFVAGTASAPNIAATAASIATLVAAPGAGTGPNLTSQAAAAATLAAAYGTATAPNVDAGVDAIANIQATTGTASVPVLLVTTTPPDYAAATLGAAYGTVTAPDLSSSAGSSAPLGDARGTATAYAPVFGEIFPSFSTLTTATGTGSAPNISAVADALAALIAATGQVGAPNITATAAATAQLVEALGGATTDDYQAVSGATERLVSAIGNGFAGNPAIAAGSVAILSVARGTGTFPPVTVSVLFLPPGPRISNVLSAGGAYTTRTVMWRASKDGRKLEVVPVTIPVSGVIQVNEDTTPMRSFSLDVNNPRWLSPYKDYVIPEVTQTDAAGNTITRQMGHYIVLPPNTSMRPGRVTGTIEAQDITYVLANDTFDDGLIVPAGTDTGAGARQIALDGGMTAKQLSLPDTGVLLSSDKYFPPGTSRLSAMTDLYGTASWYAPGSNGNGVIYSAPYNSSGTLTPRISYSTRDPIMRLVPPINETPDVGRLRNRVTVRNIQPDKPVIYETVRITNQKHPLYYGNIGIWLSETVDDGQVPDEDTARARAAMLLANGASYYRKVELTTVADLDAGLHDVIGLDAMQEGVVYDGAWMRKGWKLDIGGIVTTTQSTIYRTEPWE